MSKKPRTKKVRLSAGVVAKVAVPKNTIPVVVADSAAGVVEIAPAPTAAIKKRSWLDFLFR